MMLDVIVVLAPANSPVALARVKSRPKKCNIGISAIPLPAPPIENKTDKKNVMKPTRIYSFMLHSPHDELLLYDSGICRK
jgi:hypothetical protein